MCNLGEKQQTELDKVINIYLGSIKKYTKQGNILFFNKADYGYLQLSNMLKSSTQRVKTYIEKTYGEKFTNGWTELKKFNNVYEVHFTFPKLLSDVYEVKEGLSTYKEKFGEIPSVSLENKELSYFDEVGDYKVRYSNSKINTENLQEGLNWLKTIMPNVDPIIVEGLIDNVANGSYDIVNDLITLSKDFANKQVVKEEAFHRIFNLLPKSEQEKLLNEASKKYGITRGKSKATIKYSITDQNKIDYTLKAVDILNSDKAKQVFEKGIKNNWPLDKILTELQVPKEQKQIILDKGFRVLTNNDARILKKPDVILPIGTSGSGKSTFIKSLPQKNLVVIEPDAMRVEFTGNINDKSKDKEIYEEAANRAIDAIKQGKQVVFDTTNLTKDKRLPFIEAIKKVLPNANIQYKLMELNPELAKERIKADIAAGKNRANVPDATIDRHAESYKQMLEDIKNEPISNIEEEPNDNLREEIITSLLAENSYTVEINTAKDKIKDAFGNVWVDEYPNKKIGDYVTIDNKEWKILGTRFEDDSWGESGLDERESFIVGNDGEPTQHYSNLTVNEDFYKNNPDWEYKEQRITTPLITPSIRGHAQFAEANDIGWFRAWYNKKTGEVHVLEVQSDLFQKGRDKDNLINEYSEEYQNVDGNTIDEIIENRKNIKSNQFLQLLNKDNNWVNFFVKSIIQDSAKKGYEKVLFPTGNTASKVEGHTTLEEFKKQKGIEIMQMEAALEDYKNGTFEGTATKEQIERDLEVTIQELERVETEGFGALKPIYNFYENTVTNILNKTYGKNNVNVITDEYGNTWNEIILTPEMLETIRLNTPNGKIEYSGDLALEEKMAEEAFNSKDEKVPTTLIGKFIQSIRNMLRNIFKEKDNISRVIRDMNQGRFKNIDKKFEKIYEEILSLPEEDVIDSIKKCLI